MTDVKRNILLVDDDEEDFMIIRDMFSEFPQQSFHLDWTQSFDEAKKTIQKNGHAAYLVDYRLGSKTGLELISETRSSAPFILLTGQGDHDVDIAAMQQGAEDYLIKSQLSPQLLERSIRYAIFRAQTTKELKESREDLRRSYDERLQMESQILLQDRLASIGLMASSLAHEIGTPLGVMRGRSEMTLMNPKDSDLVSKNTEIVLAQIDRISKLIRSLLNLAKGDETKAIGSINAGEILSDVTDLLGLEFSKAKISFDNKIGAHTFVIAESGPLHQVFLNLLVNAVHAIQSAIRGGRSADHKIGIVASSSGPFWNIAITDTGCGIPEKNMKMLFKPFFTTKDVGQGTGLGLATSYRLIEAWGGDISVQSQAGKGTTFNLKLKRANERARAK